MKPGVTRLSFFNYLLAFFLSIEILTLVSTSGYFLIHDSYNVASPTETNNILTNLTFWSEIWAIPFVPISGILHDCGTSCHVHFWGCHLYCRSCSSPLLPNCLPRSPHRPYSSGTRHCSIADQPSGCRLCHQLKEGSCFCLCWYCFRSWSCYSCPWLARSRKEGRMALSLLDFSRYFTCVLFVHGIHSARPAEARI